MVIGNLKKKKFTGRNNAVQFGFLSDVLLYDLPSKPILKLEDNPQILVGVGGGGRLVGLKSQNDFAVHGFSRLYFRVICCGFHTGTNQCPSIKELRRNFF